LNDRVPFPPAPLLQSLAVLRDKALAADSLNALAFGMANDLYPLLHFRQALVFASRAPAQYELLCVSGLAKPQEDSPYLVWLRRTLRWLDPHLQGPQPRWLDRAALEPPAEVADGWAEWWPQGAWCVPLHGRNGQRLGLVMFLQDAPPPEPLQPALQGLWTTWAYCWGALSGQGRLRRWRPSGRQLMLAAVLLAALLLLPVRQTALAPAEIVSREAQVISSPIDGVIASMQVRPNQPVAAGAPLFLLDETTLRNRADVLRKEVAVADAELIAASQRAFDNAQSKSELTVLTGKSQQRRSELAGVLAQLQRTQVLSPRAGVAVYSDPNDWIGKPVSTGERILLVADPAKPAMRVELPVADAIALEPGAPVTLYLTAYPLTPLQGKILETSYQARTTDEGVVAYRLLVSIDDGDEQQRRLGLHGTAKLYGGRVVLGYYLLRRPIATARAWLGW